ncbi:MAG: helix-turn-helix transcriptional regulator [Burkholderiales bacterium]|nr:helix-turn-helix transcriptional regulator [Burkholderiales bacterium]
MYTADVLAAFSALSHSTRLGIFRLLISREPEGIGIEEILKTVGGPRSMIAVHLQVLSRAQLIQGQRIGESPVYRARLDGIYRLLHFMVDGCCSATECSCLLEGIEPPPRSAESSRRRS